jgi:hypothetical protein
MGRRRFTIEILLIFFYKKAAAYGIHFPLQRLTAYAQGWSLC